MSIVNQKCICGQFIICDTDSYCCKLKSPAPIVTSQSTPEPQPETNNEWITIESARPPANKVVMTKIDDEKGIRNECDLKRVGSLYFFPDGSVYVYYTPTHWKDKSTQL